MNTLSKLLAVIFVLNLFLYLGINFAMSIDGSRGMNPELKFHFEGDFLDRFGSRVQLDNLVESTKNNWTDYDIGINANYTFMPEQESGEVIGSNTTNYLDLLKILWSFILTLANLLISPLTIFFNFRLPVFIGLMIGLPYFFILILAFWSFIGGDR